MLWNSWWTTGFLDWNCLWWNQFVVAACWNDHFCSLKSLFLGVLSQLKYLLSYRNEVQTNMFPLPKSAFHKFVVSKHFYSSSARYNLLQSDAFKQRPVPAVRSTIWTPLFLICHHFFKILMSLTDILPYQGVWNYSVSLFVFVYLSCTFVHHINTIINLVLTCMLILINPVLSKIDKQAGARTICNILFIETLPFCIFR